MKKIHFPSIQRGYIALISAIIISAVLMILISQSALEAYFVRFNIADSEHKKESTAAADSCAWLAILAYAENPSYTPTPNGQSMVIDSMHTCVIDSLQAIGSDLVIHTHAKDADAYSETTVTFLGTPLLSIKKWQDE